MRILIAGASGFIGTRLAHRLGAHGHEVVATGRRAHTLPTGPGIEARALDVGDRAATTEALRGAEAAYYLVHSLGAAEGFSARDRALAETFAEAAADTGLKRIVYLGGLGSGRLSEHLRSRQEVGEALGATGIDVVELRAAVILGAGSVSFEMMRYLVERLPAMVCPRWVRSPIQPVAIADVERTLVEALTIAPGIYEIGGSITTYREMMQRYAAARGLRRRFIVDVPLLSLKLSSYWVDFVTPVDRRVSHSLIESLSVPVVVSEEFDAARAFSVEPVGVDEALRDALIDQADRIDAEIASLPTGLTDGVYVLRRSAPIPPGTATTLRDDLGSIGGDLGWYGIAGAWRLRFAIGRLFGEKDQVVRAAQLIEGAAVDWWHVARWDGRTLVLRADAWKPGEGWLGFTIDDERIVLTAAFRPRGVLGFLYWRLLGPAHRWAFAAMLRHRIRKARS